ncbi:response regulator [Reichenbachiella carrageenanivorans]|uniref:histidine kinase n=1 Tax=Reichenbachiella carrageenanivorans TaxID=2979869 RepID=A0ABY6D802_9BACT|nr:two-component regulator propeller domain-containing protein [Reichenbachiella carrageenanivorans]UXX81288.1 response regulator [Reichenbachiella carrageenanivorans]
MRIFFVLFATLIGSITHLQAQVINFEHIDLEDGLSQISVMAISQDALGNIWLGTRNGLNRYNGTTMTTYSTGSDSKNSLFENQIKRIKTHGDDVWILTPNAMNRFDTHTEQITNYPQPGLKSFGIYHGGIWVITEKDAYLLDQDSKQYIPKKLVLRADEIISEIEPHGDQLLIGTNHRLLVLNATAQTTLMNHVQVKSIFIDSEQNIWIGTDNNGLLKRDPSGLIKHLSGDQLSHEFVRCIQEDDHGNIWVGTFYGLDEITKEGQIKHYAVDKSRPYGLSHNSIWSLFKDQSGAMWAGTYYGGANLFNPTRNIFSFYPENTTNHESINFRVVGRMIEDKNHNLWICTDGGGLNFFDRKQNKFEYYKYTPGKNSISHNNVKGLLNQGDSILWIGTHRGGLNKMDLETKKFTSYLDAKYNPDSLPVGDISTLISYKNGFILGTIYGVIHFDPEHQTFSKFLPDYINERINERIISLFIDSEEYLWIGTEYSGLFRYSMRNGEFLSFAHKPDDERSLANNFVYQIFEDHYSRIWIATANGLNQFLPKSNDFIKYYTDQGLPGNIVFSIAASRFGGLILATNKGVSFFNVDKKTFKNITYANGLPLNELNEGGLFITSDGEVFVSGFNGMASFNEQAVLNKSSKKTPQISELFINNEKVDPTTHPEILSQSIFKTKSIDLSHFHSAITIRFTDMAFSKSEKQALEFKLEGFDQKWVTASQNSEATYTSLDDGKYVFRVRNINAPTLEARLEIKMNPPFYLSRTAYIIYLLVAIGILFLFNQQYLSRKRLEDELEMEHQKLDQNVQLNQSKLRFFTDISHEFRTPLTLIAGQIDLLLEKQNLSPSTYKKVLNIHKNTLRLKTLISELLDFRKQEQGHLKIKASKHDFIPFIEEIYLSFVELAQHAEIDYTLENDLPTVELWYDKPQLEKVFYNLLSNAFKFTPKKGKITIKLYFQDTEMAVEIINTGVGMPQESLDRIFDRFYQLDHLSTESKQGTGIGLALSKGIITAHKGSISVMSEKNDHTSFTVHIPTGHIHFDASELHTEDLDTPIISEELEFAPAVITQDVPDTETVVKTHATSTILVVEDNDEVRQFLQELMQVSFEVHVACNGQEGFERAQTLQPDLILSDVLMPVMSGTEMCSKLKTNLTTSHIPVVLLTARTAVEHKIEGLETGADDYITKPFNTKILVARINNILNNHRAIQKKFAVDPVSTTSKMAKNRIDREFLEKMETTINENLSNTKYDVAAFSRDMMLGRTNLFAKIKAITGQTPNELIMTMRLKKAAHLIATQPEATIAEIAYSCGFSNPHYFSRSFKKHFGKSPSKYLE